MGDLPFNSAFALTVQSAVDTVVTPTSADIIPCSALQPAPRTVTVDNPEYLGTVHAPASFVAGRLFSVTATFVLRGPGGTSPPAAGASVLGRVLRSIGFAESVRSTALPASPEALGVGSTTTKAVLGASAAGTADLYTGEPLFLSALGASTSNLKNYVGIRSYDASKGAGIPRTLGSAPTGTYQIPKNLTYRYSSASTTTYLAGVLWRGGKRFDVKNMAFSSARFRWQPSNRDQTAICTVEVTWECDLISTVDEACPVTSPGGNPPLFRDGAFAVANTLLGASSAEWGIEPQTVFPYDPNKPMGNAAGQIARTARTADFTINQERATTFDAEALAQAQAYHNMWVQFGSGQGNMIIAQVTDGRLSFPGDSEDGVILNPMTMYIDKAADCFTISFPFI